MQIHLRKVLEAPFHWQETTQIPVTALDRPELVELSPIEWGGSVEHDPPGFRLRATYEYRQTLACTRCLEGVAAPVRGTVELRVLAAAAEPPGEGIERELAEQELDVLVVEGESLDGRAVLLEQLQLNIPMRVLCRPDCRGLCPVCGGNRNERPCECRTAEADPRWAALAAWRAAGERRE